jgi:hypothetical protein
MGTLEKVPNCVNGYIGPAGDGLHRRLAASRYVVQSRYIAYKKENVHRKCHQSDTSYEHFRQLSAGADVSPRLILGLRPLILASRPFTNAGDESVDRSWASATASLIATGSGTSSAHSSS